MISLSFLALSLEAHLCQYLKIALPGLQYLFLEVHWNAVSYTDWLTDYSSAEFSGDHLRYKMEISTVITFHIKSQAHDTLRLLFSIKVQYLKFSAFR